MNHQPGTTLQGPRGTFINGETVARSQFKRVIRPNDDCWQWVAFDPSNRVLTVLEMTCGASPFWPDNTPTAALWTLRDIAAGYLHRVRAHRGH